MQDDQKFHEYYEMDADDYVVRFSRVGYRHSKVFSISEDAEAFADAVFLSAAQDVVVTHAGVTVYDPQEKESRRQPGRGRSGSDTDSCS